MAIDQQATPLQMPGWVPRLLMFAAVYNLVWGAFVILFPTLPFRLAGMVPPNYPALVQGLGMIVGVYGIGYALAARDPVTQWPLVLVGLIGKLLGPIGFVYAASIGEFPWVSGLTIVANDLVWWLPFISILLHAARVSDSRLAVTESPLDEVLRRTRTVRGETLDEISHRQDLLLVCLRHSGCTYCREALADLARQSSAITAAGAYPVVVHMGTAADGEVMLRKFGCQGIDQVSDLGRHVYRALQLRLGTLAELAGWTTIWRTLFAGTIFRFGFGRILGSGLQMPGAFLIRDGRIVTAYRHRSSADRVNYAADVCGLQQIA
ncbi:MAG: hypothetical protein WCJ09_23560 [Planctomycetota bacterium]